jgi:bifunctional DNA-binding transcriptional regulator/antitoxin component of YhaV-PrlF toxin-antitoxin module
VTVDNKKRVVLPTAKPGDRFEVEVSGEGFLFRRLKPVERSPTKVRFEKRGRFTVAIADQPINEQALREALADFP